MTIEELEKLRAEKWRRLPEFALSTEEDILGFIDEVGFCLIDHRKSSPLPSLLGAIETATSPRRSPEAHALLKSFWEKYRAKKRAFEWNFLLHSLSAVSSKYLPQFYALIGDRHPERDYRRQLREKTLTLMDVRVYESILKEGPISRKRLRLALNAWHKKQAAMLEQSLWRLWRGLKIVRIDFSSREGFLWQSTCSWDKRLLRRSSVWTRQEALERLILHYTEIAVATSRRQIKKVFHGIAEPSAINATVDQLFVGSRLDVDPNLVLDGKKAIVRKL